MVTDYKIGGVFFVPVGAGALLEAPVWNDHGRNWMAQIWRDKNMTSGLGRRFAERIPEQQTPGDERELYDIPEWLKPGVAIEFGADQGMGRRAHRDRWYGVVEGVWDDRIALQQYTTARRAIRASEAWKGQEMTISHVATSVLIDEARRRGLLVQDLQWGKDPHHDPVH